MKVSALSEPIRSTENILHWYHTFISIIFDIGVPEVNAIFSREQTAFLKLYF